MKAISLVLSLLVESIIKISDLLLISDKSESSNGNLFDSFKVGIIIEINVVILSSLTNIF